MNIQTIIRNQLFCSDKPMLALLLSLLLSLLP